MKRAIVVRRRLAAAFLVLATGAAEGREGSTDVAPGRAKVWFAPLPPMPTDEGRPYIGAPDFMQLFSRKARWSTAAKRVTVFKLYGEWVHGTATDRQLRRVVDDLRRRKIAIALETGPLNPTPECGEGIEGFATVASGWRCRAGSRPPAACSATSLSTSRSSTRADTRAQGRAGGTQSEWRAAWRRS